MIAASAGGRLTEWAAPETGQSVNHADTSFGMEGFEAALFGKKTGGIAVIRVCPKRDAVCPHGIDCPYWKDGPDCPNEPKSEAAHELLTLVTIWCCVRFVMDD